MAFDQATGKMVLFGGLYEVNASFNTTVADTWTWDGAKWSGVVGGTHPTGRMEPGMAYDEVHRVLILRGGESPSYESLGFIDDTWTFDGQRWVQVNPTKSAPVFIGGKEPLIWDGTLSTVDLFAFTRYQYLSYDVPDLNETWAWGGQGWSKVETSNAPAGHGKKPAAIAYDAGNRSVVFFGWSNGLPTTWVRTGTSWSIASTRGTNALSYEMSGDDARSNVVLFDSNGQTWTWDGNSWTPRNPAHSPSARVGEAMAYDPIRRVVVLFGGYAPPQSVPLLNDVWTWNGTDWTQVAYSQE